jgi:hypothetical protein
MLLSLSINKKTPLINRNKMMAIYPVRLLKNWFNSFLQMLHITINIECNLLLNKLIAL